MELSTLKLPATANSLGLAIVLSSATPLVLLDAGLVVRAASGSFCRAFGLNPDDVMGCELLALGAGEWNIPELRSLLGATVSGHAAVEAYELDLRRGPDTLNLILNAQRLDYADAEEVHLLLAVTDVTAARIAEQLKDDLVREKQVLLQELQHRVANSLQIIASVLMQSARKVQSEEARVHLNDAHHRVMSIATLQRQLAVRDGADVALQPYFSELCDSIGASMISDPDRLEIMTRVDRMLTTSDVSVSMGLIVTELVINAIKHAFPDNVEKGTIVVDFSAHGLAWVLTVRDDGAGRPEDFTPGLGTGIVAALSRQLKASVETSDAHPGTLVTISHGQAAAL